MKITYDQYMRFKRLSIDELMSDHFFTVQSAISIFNECKRIHGAENPIGINFRETLPWINKRIEEAEVRHYEGD